MRARHLPSCLALRRAGSPPRRLTDADCSCGAVKKKAPFPVYSVEQREVASCPHGEDCDPHENPEHHVKIDLSPEARAVIRAALSALQEARSWNVADLKSMDEITPDAAMLKARAKVLSPKIARDLCDLLAFAEEV